MFDTTRRKLLGASMIGAGAVMNGFGASASAAEYNTKGNILLDRMPDLPRGLGEVAGFPLIEAIHGRRSRRFAKGASIPDGPLAYTSKHEPAPLSELEQMLLLTTVAGNTGWSNLIPHNRFYLPKIPNYAGAAGGRTFPSSAGFHTSEIFYTDDDGVYFFPTRDMGAAKARNENGETDLKAYLDEHKSRIVKLADGRLKTPAQPQHMEMHNEWCANVPGSTFIMPVADLAQHMVLTLCYLVQNGACIYDDVNNQPIPGIEKFKHLVDVENPYPLAYVEQLALTEVTVELSTSCYAGALMLQAMGLGGWMYDGVNQFSVLGAGGDPEVPGLGFRFDMIEGQPCRMSPGWKAFSKAIARRISRTCAPRSCPSSNASSVQEARSMPKHRAPTRKAVRSRQRGADECRVRRLREPHGAICLRQVRPFPGHCAGDLQPDVPAGASARHRVLR